MHERISRHGRLRLLRVGGVRRHGGAPSPSKMLALRRASPPLVERARLAEPDFPATTRSALDGAGTAMKPRHRRFAWIGCGRRRCSARRGSAGAKRVPVQTRVLLPRRHAGDRRKRKLRREPSISDRRARRSGQPDARQPFRSTVHLRASPTIPRNDACRWCTTACCRTSSRKAKAWSPQGSLINSGRHVPGHAKCSRSTTRITCRRQPPPRVDNAQREPGGMPNLPRTRTGQETPVIPELGHFPH